MSGENPVLSQASKKGVGRKRIVLGILAAPFAVGAILLAVLATVGLPLTTVARMALGRTRMAPMEASIESAHIRWRFPGTLRVSLRGARVDVHGADPVVAVADTAVDFSIGRLIGGRVLPSQVSVSGAEFWVRAKPDGGIVSTIPLSAGADNGASKVAANSAPPFTLSGIPASCWLRAGEETQIAIAGLQLNVLPAVRQNAFWHSPVLSMEGSLAGGNPGLIAKLTLRNASGATLVEGAATLRPDSEKVDATATIPHVGFRDMLALLPPGLIPPGVAGEGAADIRLQLQAQLPLPGEVAAEWEAHLSPSRLTLPDWPKPLEFPETRLGGKASLKGAQLEASAQLAGGGRAPWTDVQLDAAMNLQSLKGTFHVKSPGTDLAQLAAMVPQWGLSFATATALRLDASADFDGCCRAAENVRLRLDLDAGQLITGNRKLDTPGIGIVVSGRAAPGFPASDARMAVSANAVFPHVTVSMDSDGIWDGKSGRLRVRSHSTPFDAGLFLQYFPRLPAGTALSLPVSWEIEADLDTNAGSMRQARAALELGAGSLAMPEFLNEPLAIAPCRFAAEIDDEGATCTIAPYNWTVGPLNLHSDGGGWKRTGDLLDGGFSFEIGRMKIADGVALLSRKIRDRLPPELAEVGDLAVASFKWREHISGAWKGGQPVFDRTVADGSLELAIGPEPLSVLLHLEMPVPPLTAHAEVTIPDFVQARWRLPLLDRLPVPWLDAPAKAQFTADWEFPARLKSARWRVEAGAGRILPRGLLAKWLGEPVPLTRFAAGGTVGSDFSRFDISEFVLESGRARCWFDKFSVEIAPDGDRRRVHAGGNIVLENWFAADFVPLLRGPVRAGLPGQGTGLLDLGLEKLAASIDATVAVETSGNVLIESLKHDGSCVLRIGDQPLPLTTTAGYDPVAHQVFFRTEIADLRPAQFKPQLARGLPVTPSVFDFPVSLRLETRSTVPGDFPRNQPSLPEIAVTVRGGPGTIHRCDFLAADTPLKSLEVEADASIGDQALKSFRAKIDFGGPTVCIDSLRAHLGGTPAAEVTASLSELPLDWVLARVPSGLLPPNARDLLPRLAVGGVVRSLRVAAEARGQAGKPAMPEIVALRIDGDVEKAAVHLKDWPALTIGHIGIASDAQAIWAAATDIQAGPLQAPALEITASQLFGGKAVISGKLTASMHLAELPAFLRSLPATLVLPESFDWSKLDGNLTAEATFGTDLAHLADPAAVTADAKIKVVGLTAPAIAGQFETAPGSLDASLKFKNGVAEMEGSMATNLKRGFDVIEGSVQTRFAVRAALAGKAEATVQVDLLGASLRAPAGLAWAKAPGVEASLQARVGTDDFHCPGNAASATFDVAGKGLVYGRFGLKGRVEEKLASAGMPAAVKLVCDSIEADDTSLRLEADAALPRSLDVRLSGSRLDLRPLARLAAPQFAALNVPANPTPPPAVASGPKPAGAVASAIPPVAIPSPASTASVPAAPVSQAPSAAAASSFPAETKVQVTLQEIVLGNGRSIAPFSLSTQLRGTNLVSGELSFDSLNHGVRANLQPAADRGNWSLKIDDVADLLAVATSPLHELPASVTAADTTVGGLMNRPADIEGGRFTADGTLDLDNASNLVQGHLQITDLLLRREIPFLSSIAGLVKRSVKKGTPFDEIRIDSFTIGRNDAHLQNAVLSGPITLTAERFDLDLVKSELFLRGKIFGIWFEAKGPRSNPEIYLSDKNKALNLLTTEEEFQW